MAAVSVLAALALMPPLWAQVRGESVPSVREPLRPRLLATVPVGRVRLYELEERLQARQLFPDGKERQWQRTVRYRLRLYAFSAREGDMTDLACRVESIRYEFQQDTLREVFSSEELQRAAVRKPRTPDLDDILAVMGTEIELTLSPYGDVARIGGEGLEWLREYIAGELAHDAQRRSRLLERVADARWQALFDLHGGIVPGIRVREDSTWTRLLTLWVEGLRWTDTARIRLAAAGDTSRLIQARLEQLVPERGQHWLFGFPEPLTVLGGSGTAQWEVELLPQGLIRRSHLRANLELELGDSTPFRQFYTVERQWRFLGEQ
jgi:hypothetical protein